MARRGFFNRPFVRTALAIGTAGGSELARAAVRKAQGKKVNLQRTALAALTGGASELAYGARDVPRHRVYPQRRSAGRRVVGLDTHDAPQAAPQAAAGPRRPSPLHRGPQAPQRPAPGRFRGSRPVPRHPMAPPRGRLYPQRRLAGRRVAGLPDDD